MSAPELVSICLCERILQDVFRKDAVTLVNVHNTTSSEGFPTLVPVIYAFAQLKGFNKPFTYRFVITDSKNEVISSSNFAQVETLPTGDPIYKVISAFSGLILPAADVYTVSLEVEGKVMGSIPYEVDQVKIQQATEAH